MSEQYKRQITLSGVTNQSDLQNTVRELVAFANRTSSQINSELQRLERLLAQMQTATDTINTVLSGITGSTSSGASSTGNSVNVTAGIQLVTFMDTLSSSNYNIGGIIFATDGSVAMPRFQVNANSAEGDTRTASTVRVDCDIAGILTYGAVVN